MISEKTLNNEIKMVKKAIKVTLKDKDYHELANLCTILDTLEFVRDWNENE